MTHVYLSPILQANPGSAHGYDVVDRFAGLDGPRRENAFRAMVAEFHRHRLGVVVDVVPNHMARPTPESLNQQLWSVLYQGRKSPYAHWFDVDWEAQDAGCSMPILGGPLEKCLDDFIIDTALRDPEHPGHCRTGAALFRARAAAAGRDRRPALGVLLAQQHYRLAGLAQRRPPS